MWFRIFLWLVYWRLKLRLFFLSRKNPTIFAELKNEPFALQVQTKNLDIVRSFIFSQGSLSSKAFPLPSDLTLKHLTITFNSAKEAISISRAVRKEKHQVFTFIQEKSILIDGDFNLIQTLLGLKEKLDQA